MNPRLKVIEDLLQIDVDCDSIIIKYDDSKFTYICLKEEGDDYKEVSKGDIVDIIAFMIYKFCIDLDIQLDIAGSSSIYNKKNGLQILASILSFPNCIYEIVYHSDIDKGNFGDNLSDKLRNSFQVI